MGMDIFDSLVLGLIQGLTEFIPISSSGHLSVLSELFGIESTFEFETILNIGTLLAASIYFRKTIVELSRELFGRAKDRSLLYNVAVATIPVLIGGVAVALYLETFVRGKYVTAAALIIVGIMMLWSKAGVRAYSQLKKNESFRIGLWQALALIPGVSRSGITIIGSQRNGLSGADAAQYSFILSIPAVAAAVIYTLAFDSAAAFSAPLSVAVGIAASFVSSLFAIHFMISFLKKRGLRVFGVYRIIFGLVLLLVL